MLKITRNLHLVKGFHGKTGFICQFHSNSFKNYNGQRYCSNVNMEKTLTVDNMNSNVIKMEYAVRGPLVIRATAIEKEMEEGIKKPFSEVIKANIGDAHAMGQKPISFLRQVISMCLLPELLESPQYPDDVKKRVNTVLNGCKGRSMGSYSESVGIEIIRKHIAEYIERRDGFPANYNDIILCAGASEAIRSVLALFITHEDNEKVGVMVPIPQYPLYSATTAEFGLLQINYYLEESKNWAMDISELERAIEEAKKVCKPKVICVINPGNPTGQVLPKENIIEIIKFAHKENLFIFADEVYQDNVYAEGSQFHSFKKVIMEMGPPYSGKELASFMSCSKGYMGECGLRGGYGEIINMDPQVKTMFFKMLSAKLCPTTLGQAVMECVVNPPQPGEPSYKKFSEEKSAVLSSLAKRAKMVVETFNSIDGISCQTVQGAMYAFPQVKFPPKLIEEAKKNEQPADVFYAFQLLENTGICIIPGTGFCQKPGTYHFRTTILPQQDKLEMMLNKFKEFHISFINKYAN